MRVKPFRIVGAAWALLLLFACVAVLSNRFPLTWWASLSEHFRYHGIVLLLVIGGIALARKRFKIAGVFGLLILIMSPLTRMNVPDLSSMPGSADEVLVVAHANLGAEPDLNRLAVWLTEIDADVISLQEVRPGQLTVIDQALDGWHRRIAEARDDTRGVAIWSRPDRVPTSAEIIWPGDSIGADRPVARVQFEIDGESLEIVGESLEIVGVHFARPRNAARFKTQQRELSDLLDHDRNQRANAIVWIGDFNATPWSSLIWQAYDLASLARVPAQSLWPATYLDGPLLKLGLPIDFALARGISDAQYAVGPSIGSDHRPIAVTVSP
ncbi:MAG: endonuclease/exonuclease/phosphatase family protein [Planctomycetota bacterium]